MSAADLDTLDRGVIEAGLTAAEAVARVEALEMEMRALTEGLARVFAATGHPVPAALAPAFVSRSEHEAFRACVARQIADLFAVMRQAAEAAGIPCPAGLPGPEEPPKRETRAMLTARERRERIAASGLRAVKS